jgi:alkylation response protein AidB-like acyl-CoA dehydrogenase
MTKVAMAKVYHDIVQRAVQLHGALGTSRETLLAILIVASHPQSRGDLIYVIDLMRIILS